MNSSCFGIFTSILMMWIFKIATMMMAQQQQQINNCNSLVVIAYTNAPQYRPSHLINRQAIAGLWKLSKIKPLKEFTVFPKEESFSPELLLMLNEDGSFKRYFNQQETTHGNNQNEDDDDDNDDESYDISTEWGDFINYQKMLDPSWKNVNKGTWDFCDGELMLAVDRQTKNNNNPNSATATNTNINDSTDDEKKSCISSPTKNHQSPSTLPQQDTLLVGEVAASVVPVNDNNNNNYREEQQQQILSVPIGSLNVGKFTYPKKHPSFFDQPMFQPKPKSAFQLRQVLGTFQYQIKEEPIIEKFTNKDFHNKRFTLTSQPLSEKKRKTNKRDISYKKRMEEEEKERNRLVMNIRVMEVMFFANNTFTTVAGLGGNTILRGRYDVIGKEKDQIWMQVRRFGFGRSVSGSVYSEGLGLSHEEEKSYRGEISFEDDNNNNEGEQQEQSLEGKIDIKKKALKDNDNNVDTTSSKRIQAEGSVILGFGLEPQPVAKFIMREVKNEELEYDDEEEDDDDDDVPIVDDWSNAFQ